jgi:hypothetical protein
MGPAGWNTFMLTRGGFERAGLFDENIYPAFCEDSEYTIRISKLKPPLNTTTYADVIGVHGTETLHGYHSGIKSNEKLGENLTYVMRRWPLNCNYVRRKWGCMGEVGEHQNDWLHTCAFDTPFNRTDSQARQWHHSMTQRQRDSLYIWQGGHGIINQTSGNLLYPVPKSYSNWTGFQYKESDECPLTGILSKVTPTICY